MDWYNDNYINQILFLKQFVQTQWHEDESVCRTDHQGVANRWYERKNVRPVDKKHPGRWNMISLDPQTPHPSPTGTLLHSVGLGIRGYERPGFCPTGGNIFSLDLFVFMLLRQKSQYWHFRVVCEKPDMMRFTSEIQVSDILNLLVIQILIPETERVDGEFSCEENIILFNKKRWRDHDHLDSSERHAFFAYQTTFNDPASSFALNSKFPWKGGAPIPGGNRSTILFNFPGKVRNLENFAPSGWRFDITSNHHKTGVNGVWMESFNGLL